MKIGKTPKSLSVHIIVSESLWLFTSLFILFEGDAMQEYPVVFIPTIFLLVCLCYAFYVYVKLAKSFSGYMRIYAIISMVLIVIGAVVSCVEAFYVAMERNMPDLHILAIVLEYLALFYALTEKRHHKVMSY